MFGRELHRNGRPYNHYAETINAVSALRPSLRRVLQGAWDLAFTWLREEPPTHHVAIQLCYVWFQHTFGTGHGLQEFSPCLGEGSLELEKFWVLRGNTSFSQMTWAGRFTTVFCRSKNQRPDSKRPVTRLQSSINHSS